MSEVKNKTTTVSVSKETYKMLQEICKKSESYDELIKKLILLYKERLLGEN